MTEDERQDWAENLRTRSSLLAAMAGVLYEVVTLLIFGGDPDMPGVVQVFLGAIGSFIMTLVAFSSILVRQLTLPVALGVAIYGMFHFDGRELSGCLNLCGLAVITMIAFGIVEAFKTTGLIKDFWRSFLFHPLDWSTHFHIQTRVDRTEPEQ